jgi:hypothetical protein
MRNMSPSRILGEQMKELNDLADKSLAIRILDNEAHRTKILQNFQRVERATKSFFVCTIIIYKVRHIHIRRSQVEMAISIQQTASRIHDETKVSI